MWFSALKQLVSRKREWYGESYYTVWVKKIPLSFS